MDYLSKAIIWVPNVRPDHCEITDKIYVSFTGLAPGISLKIRE